MFSERLAYLRKNKKLTHQNMADSLGITRQGYGYYENGKREPDLNTLQKLADLLETTTDYLLGRTDDPASGYASGENNEPKNNFTYFRGVKEEVTEEEADRLKEELEMYRALKEKRMRENRK